MKNNKLIAEFMGVGKHYEAQSSNMFNQYHTSWDRLMPVIEKIEGFNDYDVEILQYGTRVLKNSVEIITNVADFSFDKKIEHCYDAIIKFIKDHNKQKQI